MATVKKKKKSRRENYINQPTAFEKDSFFYKNIVNVLYTELQNTVKTKEYLYIFKD